MCNSPSRLANGNLIACRLCWQCKARKVDDWTGRNIAESQTATAAHVVTLTYGKDLELGTIDHIRAAVLTYSDVQKFLKKLRNNGLPARYFVVGEYGSLKGRSHWHIVLYWQGEAPDVPLRENVMYPHWEHGWTYWDRMSPEAIRYACKYLTKVSDDPAHQGFGPMPSKKPPLGDAYFRQLAQQYVDAGLSPQDFFYSFPDVRRVPAGEKVYSRAEARRRAKPVRFLMQGKTRENFRDYFIEAWELAYPNRPWPRSEALYSLDKRNDPPWMATERKPDQSSYFDSASGLYWRLGPEGQRQWGEIKGLKGIVWDGEEKPEIVRQDEIGHGDDGSEWDAAELWGEEDHGRYAPPLPYF